MSNVLDNIHVGEFLFEFTTHGEWVNKAADWFTNAGAQDRKTICIDNLGRICANGADFAAADRDIAFPIRVYWRRP